MQRELVFCLFVLFFLRPFVVSVDGDVIMPNCLHNLFYLHFIFDFPISLLVSLDEKCFFCYFLLPP